MGLFQCYNRKAIPRIGVVIVDFAQILAEEFSISLPFMQNIISLIDEGNTIPFIARYRKEKTGSCDDQILREAADRLDYLRGLQKRREEITASITEQGKMTEEIASAIAEAGTLAGVRTSCTNFNGTRTYFRNIGGRCYPLCGSGKRSC